MKNNIVTPLSKEEPSNVRQTLPKRSAQVARGGVMVIIRPLLAAVGLFFIVVGVPIAFLTPIPFVPIGLPIVILGVVLLARNSLAGRRWMQKTIAKHPNLKRFAPNWLLNLIFGDNQI